MPDASSGPNWDRLIADVCLCDQFMLLVYDSDHVLAFQVYTQHPSTAFHSLSPMSKQYREVELWGAHRQFHPPVWRMLARSFLGSVQLGPGAHDPPKLVGADFQEFLLRMWVRATERVHDPNWHTSARTPEGGPPCET